MIVGASLAGLMAALSLSRVGIRVTLLERSDDTGRIGTALHVENGLLQKITGTKRTEMQPLASGVQTWFAVHAGLKAVVETDPNVQLHQQAAVQSVDQDASSAWAITSDGRTFRGDILIGADGHRSVVRRSVSPANPDATFAGYVIWLGLTPETAIPARHAWPRDVAILNDDDAYLLGYPLPGSDGALQPGSRQLGWAWYDSSRNDLLRNQGSVVGNVVHHSLLPAEIPDETIRALADESRERWPAPWLDAILDCIKRRAIIGTPIAEYVPDRLVNGRLALVGDAAHVPTPMTGSGFSASMQDAMALAESVSDGLRATNAEMGLRRYEARRLGGARQLVLSGQQFSRTFSRRGG